MTPEKFDPLVGHDDECICAGNWRAWDHQQAKIDALMMEYCPEEMTPEQIAEWERHQLAEYCEARAT